MKQRLGDEEYGRVLDNLVIGCVDVAVTNNNDILLERRLVDPIQGELWIFGGRMLVGDELRETAQRSISRELGMDVPQERFQQLGVFNLRWPTRREPLSTNGCHHLLIAHSLELSDAEREHLDAELPLRPQETAWFDRDEPGTSLLDEMWGIIQSTKFTR